MYIYFIVYILYMFWKIILYYRFIYPIIMRIIHSHSHFTYLRRDRLRSNTWRPALPPALTPQLNCLVPKHRPHAESGAPRFALPRSLRPFVQNRARWNFALVRIVPRVKYLRFLCVLHLAFSYCSRTIVILLFFIIFSSLIKSLVLWVPQFTRDSLPIPCEYPAS